MVIKKLNQKFIVLQLSIFILQQLEVLQTLLKYVMKMRISG